MGELADEIAAKLSASPANTRIGRHLLEHGTLPDRSEPLIDETFALLLEFQRTLGEVLVEVANEIDDLRGT